LESFDLLSLHTAAAACKGKSKPADDLLITRRSLIHRSIALLTPSATNKTVKSLDTILSIMPLLPYPEPVMAIYC
jgi:hypothetical protein